jgi:hypothetical protein
MTSVGLQYNFRDRTHLSNSLSNIFSHIRDVQKRSFFKRRPNDMSTGPSSKMRHPCTQSRDFRWVSAVFPQITTRVQPLNVAYKRRNYTRIVKKKSYASKTTSLLSLNSKHESSEWSDKCWNNFVDYSTSLQSPTPAHHRAIYIFTF